MPRSSRNADCVAGFERYHQPCQWSQSRAAILRSWPLSCSTVTTGHLPLHRRSLAAHSRHCVDPEEARRDPWAPRIGGENGDSLAFSGEMFAKADCVLIEIRA